MKEYLSQKGISYREKNVAEDTGAREEMVGKTGRMAVPTVTAGSRFVVGFDRKELDRLLS
ncbi:MAG TPA: glutaredoxin domain-containing protein [Bacillota bacterium]|nr:glutaredoxin domain-containing protein [Bacillota bacterium]